MSPLPTEPSRAPEFPPTDAMDSRPVVGPEIHVRLALSPGMITVLSAPIAVLLSMLLAWILLTTVGVALHPAEMLAGAIVNTAGGLAASIPLFAGMKKGAIAIAQAGLAGIAVRMGTVFLGLLAAGAPGWGLDRTPLVGWVLGFYFPLLITETALVSWLIRRAKR
jgi:hypothetical protein